MTRARTWGEVKAAYAQLRDGILDVVRSRGPTSLTNLWNEVRGTGEWPVPPTYTEFRSVVRGLRTRLELIRLTKVGATRGHGEITLVSYVPGTVLGTIKELKRAGECVTIKALSRATGLEQNAVNTELRRLVRLRLVRYRNSPCGTPTEQAPREWG